MAKILLLVSLLLYITVATPVLAEWSAATNKIINDMQLKVDKALMEAVTTTPPAKRAEAEKAAQGFKTSIAALLSMAKASGDETKAISIAESYEKAADTVIASNNFLKSEIFELTFSNAAMPDRTKCPNIDKSYCETYSKCKEAKKGVIHAAPPAKKDEIFNAVFSIRGAEFRNIKKAYATGDEKEIARVLAAYNKAADAVIAAAPAEKFKVMEEAYAAANEA